MENKSNKNAVKKENKEEVITDDEIYSHEDAKKILHLMKRGRLRKREEQ